MVKIMGMDATALLAYGIDFEDQRPSFLGDYDGEIDEWAEDDERSEFMEPVHHEYGHEVILAVKGYVHEASYGTEEIESLEVDPVAKQAFIDALVEAGYENPQPKWILAVEVSY
jgi:hypothetical protein